MCRSRYLGRSGHQTPLPSDSGSERLSLTTSVFVMALLLFPHSTGHSSELCIYMCISMIPVCLLYPTVHPNHSLYSSSKLAHIRHFLRQWISNLVECWNQMEKFKNSDAGVLPAECLLQLVWRCGMDIAFFFCVCVCEAPQESLRYSKVQGCSKLLLLGLLQMYTIVIFVGEPREFALWQTTQEILMQPQA